MLASQRFDRIIELVNDAGIMDIKELAKVLNVTEATIRRDCEKLEQQKKLERVHGGAKSIGQKERITNYNDQEMKTNILHYHEKDNVCRRAASFVHDGECIYLDGGTTIVPMLKYLKGKRLKIVTPSMLITNMFEDDDSELFLTGGKFARDYHMMVGPIVSENLKKFNFDHVFIGCTGVEIHDGVIYTGEVDTMGVKEVAMQQAVKKYLLIDSSKFDIKGFYSLLKITDFDHIICNFSTTIELEGLPENVMLIEE